MSNWQYASIGSDNSLVLNRCHYLNQRWPRLPTHICVTQPQWVNTLRPRQNGCHISDDISKRIFSDENVWIPIKISLKFVPQGLINNIPALVQIMAWRRQATSHYLNQWWLFYRCIYASRSLNELKVIATQEWMPGDTSNRARWLAAIARAAILMPSHPC